MKPLQVFIFNVGQGDNILLRLPDGTYGFIDFFYDRQVNGLTLPPSLFYVQHNHQASKQPEVSFFHLSHYHTDHIKGSDKWLAWVAAQKILVHQVWLPCMLPPSTILNKFVEALNDEQAVISILSENPGWVTAYNNLKETYGSGVFSKLEAFYRNNKHNTEFLSLRSLPNVCEQPEIKAYCFAPHSTRCVEFIQLSNQAMLLKLLDSKKRTMLDGNDISAILQLRAGSHRLLFGGDANKDSIEESNQYLNNYPEVLGHSVTLVSNYIKIFHHGSDHSSSSEIWQALLPGNNQTWVSISAGDGQYGHPHLETLNTILSAAASKQTEVLMYATNRDQLDNDRQVKVNSTTDIMYVNWPLSSKRLSQEQKQKEMNVDTYSVGLVAPSKEVSSASDELFLGYCFEFDLDSHTAVRVYKMLPKSE